MRFILYHPQFLAILLVQKRGSLKASLIVVIPWFFLMLSKSRCFVGLSSRRKRSKRQLKAVVIFFQTVSAHISTIISGYYIKQVVNIVRLTHIVIVYITYRLHVEKTQSCDRHSHSKDSTDLFEKNNVKLRC